MTLLGCHDVCPKELPLQTQIAFDAAQAAELCWPAQEGSTLKCSETSIIRKALIRPTSAPYT
jgi:hypothetical protein